MSHYCRCLAIAAFCVFAASACIAPEDQRPGLWLSGEVVAAPSDWAFTDAHKEIALQVATPYFLAHSVIIWCVSVDGQLYIAARDPDAKRWPGWVEEKPDVRLGIDGKIYDAALARLDDAPTIHSLRGAYAAKYDLPPRPPEEAPPMRYWRVDSRG